MPLRIAFDLDGVLADMESELVRQAALLFGEQVTRPLREHAHGGAADGGAADGVPPSPTDTPEKAKTPAEQPAPAESSPDVLPLLKMNMTGRQQRRLWRHVASIERFWESLPEIEAGAVARLASVATDRRWEVIFLTKRPASAGPTAQVQTQRWLESKGFTLPSVYVVQGSRGRIAEALGLDVVVDDRAENCIDDVVDSKARAILVWREDQKSLPLAVRRLGIGVVGTVGECLAILTEVDAATQEQPGVVNRVMRLLGLKEPAGV